MAGDRLYKKNGGNVWYGYFYGPDNKAVYICTKQTDRNAARAVLREHEREAHAAPGSARAKGETGHTVEDALGHFLQVGCLDIAPATKDMYEHQAGHLKRLLGTVDVGKLTLDDTHEYVQQRIKEGAHRETVRKELVGLRRALTLAFDRKVLRIDPRGLIPRVKVRYVPKDRFLSPAEFEVLMRMLPPARRLWVALAVFTGARASEVEGVQWETVDLEKHRLLLPGTKTNKSRRWVPIAEPLAVVLQQIHPDARHGNVVPKWENVRRDLAAFVKAQNRTAKAKAKEAGKQAPPEMRRISPNDLRRTFASWLKQAGVDSMIVAKMLGHTTSRMVELVYGHLNDATTQAAIVKLPTPATPKLGDMVPSTEDPTKERRRRGIAAKVATPELRLIDAPAAPTAPQLTLVPEQPATEPVPELRPAVRGFRVVGERAAVPTEPLPADEPKAEGIPAWRARGRHRLTTGGKANAEENASVSSHAHAGSKWVVKPARIERTEKRVRRSRSQSSSEVVVPRAGIEPATRGFSGSKPSRAFNVPVPGEPYLFPQRPSKRKKRLARRQHSDRRLSGAPESTGDWRDLLDL